MYWTTKDGRKLKISEMKTSHILNCIRMMDRQMCAAINKAANRNDECYADPPIKWLQQYEELQYAFIKELSSLKDDFYNGLANLIQHNVIERMFPLNTNYTRLEEEKKKFYDWFLPKQKAFAEQWNLDVNSD